MITGFTSKVIYVNPIRRLTGYKWELYLNFQVYEFNFLEIFNAKV